MSEKKSEKFARLMLSMIRIDDVCCKNNNDDTFDIRNKNNVKIGTIIIHFNRERYFYHWQGKGELEVVTEE